MNETKNAILRALIEGVIYELMVKTKVDNVYVDDATTLAAKLAEVILALNGKVKISDIVNDLTTGGTKVPLSAEQGKVLKDLIDNIEVSGGVEIDPTVPAWAKQSTKPTYTAAEIPMQNLSGSPLLIDTIQQIVNALNAKYSESNPPPNQTAAQVGADPAGTASAAVTAHNTNTDAHNDLRLEIQNINARLTAFFDSDDATLDELSEIVAYITSNKTIIEAITTSKVSVIDIVDNLTTNVVNKPLSAAQGVVLKGLIDAVSGSLSNYQPKGDYALRSEIPTVPTKVSAFTNDAGYLTEHQDISGKLDANKLPEAIDTALAQAKESGDFNGSDGERGGKWWSVTTAPSQYTTAVDGYSPKWRIALAKALSQSQADEILPGDIIQQTYFTFPVIYVTSDYVYLGTRALIRGAAGAKGTTPVKGTDYWTDADREQMVAETAASLNPVQYTEQTLTDAQKAQARANIGISVEEPAEDDIPKVFINGVIPTTKDDVLAEMQYISKTERFSAFLKIKCQGSSSMSYDKKNFTVKLYADEARETKLEKTFRDWDHASHKFVLKANYIDHSHARNIVCANLWDEVVSSRADYDTLPTEMRNSPRNGAVDGFPIKVYTNGTYQGIYTWNIGKDDWMWGMDEDNTNHVLICGETNTDGVYSENACNFRTLWSGVDGEDWSIEDGTNSRALKDSLNALIACVMDTDDDTFRSTIGNYLDVQSAIDYYLHMYVTCDIDGLAKNMLLATYDGSKWICGAYDMDATIGITPQGATSVLATCACPEEYKERFSLLWQRMVNVYYEEMKARYAELRTSVYSFGNIVSKFERFMDVIGLELLAEDATIYPVPSSTTNNIKYIRDFVRDRLVYTDEMIPNLRPSIPCTGITLDTASLTLGAEAQQLIATVTPTDTTDAIVWTSSDETVATVNGGLVKAVKSGNCVITATCGNYSATCAVTVTQVSIDAQLVWYQPYYLSGDTGEMRSSGTSEDQSSDFVNLYSAKKILTAIESFIIDGTSINNGGRIHFYDVNKEYISYIGTYEIAYAVNNTIPDNAVYARFYGKSIKERFVCMTDVDANGFTKLDTADFLENHWISDNQIVSTTNVTGYFDVDIPVTAGQEIAFMNAALVLKGDDEVVYNDRFVAGKDSSGNILGSLVDTGGRTFTLIIPDGVTRIVIGCHHTARNYIYYKIFDN